MDETGLWRLFWATGLPEAWLALRAEDAPGETPEAAAVPAFVSLPGETAAG